MNNKLALQILGLIHSDKKKGFPFKIQEVWSVVFPGKDFPSSEIISLGFKVTEPDFDKAKDLLFDAAIEHIALRLH